MMLSAGMSAAKTVQVLYRERNQGRESLHFWYGFRVNTGVDKYGASGHEIQRSHS